MKLKLLFLLVIIPATGTHACQCPSRGIVYEADCAFDIVVARVVAEKEDPITCGEFYLDHSFMIQIEFSYKGNLKGTQKIFAGQGGGPCGAILWTGVDYLLVVQKYGDHHLYATMCNDNTYLHSADDHVKFLNQYYNKDYHITDRLYFIAIMLLCLAVASCACIVVFSYYKQTRDSQYI
ncbi:hypothetical protein [Ohtaekwangia koreensis]|uniref:Tissue inhibitor of metalloproteinase n=1 Tax=Ohtaekwangia koreensis TaxID=688867 RepID=A0A1T5LPK9_9BACT|nr:hypothetical protein [Ohtaekwangia koreensis]SKC77854.1 hypothetical protein SAMN05660236_3645 [Ohtaekwangia koreensis]